LTKSSKNCGDRKKTNPLQGKNHKSCIKGNKRPLNLETEKADFLQFCQIIHRTEKLKFIVLFGIIAVPVRDEKVIHSPVIHSSRSIVCFFAPGMIPADRRNGDGSRVTLEICLFHAVRQRLYEGIP
jgi:hypothetical protein